MASNTSSGRRSGQPLEITLAAEESAVMAVARALGTAATDAEAAIPPLYESVDPDALNDLQSSFAADDQLTFTHHGFEITVGATTVSLTPVA